MTQGNLTIKVDENDRKRFEVFCNETGMNVSSAVNMFIKAVLRENKIPFEIKFDPFYSEKNVKYIEKIVSDINNKKTQIDALQIGAEEDDIVQKYLTEI